MLESLYNGVAGLVNIVKFLRVPILKAAAKTASATDISV